MHLFGIPRHLGQTLTSDILRYLKIQAMLEASTLWLPRCSLHHLCILRSIDGAVPLASAAHHPRRGPRPEPLEAQGGGDRGASHCQAAHQGGRHGTKGYQGVPRDPQSIKGLKGESPSKIQLDSDAADDPSG